MDTNTKFPKISIVTPSYNSAKFIEDCIQSVLYQNYPNFEHIICDGGSTDGTVKILEKYPHLKWISEPDNGQTDAINKGLKVVTGDIIAYLNSDDMYCREVFETVAKYFHNYSECMWLAGNLYFTNENGIIFQKKKPIYSNLMARLGMISLYQPNVFIRRKVIEIIGYPRNDFHAIMDMEWFLRIAKKWAPHIVNFDIALFRWHKDSKSSSPKHSDHYKKYIVEKCIVFSEYIPTMKPILKLAPQTTIGILNVLGRGIKNSIRIKNILISIIEKIKIINL